MSVAHRVLKVPMAAPDDTEPVESALKAEHIEIDQVQAIMCMTEGDGLARNLGSLAFSNLFHRRLGWDLAEVPKRIPLIMIGGCSGLVSPYAAVFVNDPALQGASNDAGLAIGVTTTRDVGLEEFGRTAMVDLISDAVRSAMKDAGIELEDVHNVQIKAPWPTGPQLMEARKQGRDVVTVDGGSAGPLARAAGALGVATALGEINRTDLKDEDIGRNWDFRTNIGSASAGGERTNVAVLVLGNSRTSRSPFRIGHGVMEDGIDVHGVYASLANARIQTNQPLPMDGDNSVDHVFLKSAVELASECRGRRHVLQTDYLGPYSWLIAKGVIHATVASIVGDPMMQVSGGGEHQGPPGGGLVAVIAKH